ncbi:MAG: flagellar protein FlaG [Burkholderiales bacterium]
MDIAAVVSAPAPVPVVTPGGGGPARVAQNAPAAGAPASNDAISSPAGAQGTPSPDAVANGVKQLNDSFAKNNVSLYASFEKDKITGIEVVQLKDKDTHETIRQVPSKTVLAIAQSIDLPQGMLGQLIYDKS